jgi:hypothetical protein
METTIPDSISSDITQDTRLKVGLSEHFAREFNSLWPLPSCNLDQRYHSDINQDSQTLPFP